MSRIDDARVLVACGELEKALALLEARLAEAPRDVEALVLKASVLVERRQEEAALPLCEQAAGADPQSAAALNALARCLHVLGRNEEALRAARRAQEVLPIGDNFQETSSVYLTLVWCLRELRQLREAVAVAEEGLLRCPDVVLAHWAGVVEEELAEAERERC